MLNFINSLTCGSFFILAFIIAINPRRVNIAANKWLSFFLLSVGLVMIDAPLSTLGLYTKYPLILIIINFAVFLIAPTLYLSIVYFVTPAKIFHKKDLWHFLPALLITILSIPTLLSLSEASTNDRDAAEAINDIIANLVLVILPISIYWFLAYRKLMQHQRHIRLFSSSLENIDLAWLRNLLWGLAGMILIFMNEIINISPILARFSPILYGFSAYYLAYFALKQGEIFAEKPQEILEIKTLIEESEEPTIVKKQLLADEQLQVLKNTLIKLMEDGKPYLDSTLSLSKLAQQMQLSTHELSYLINEGFEGNFFSFINRYRVEESKRILMTPQYQHLSMVGIAFEAGFNSKTAFNTAFKKMVGVSPTEFQKLKDS